MKFRNRLKIASKVFRSGTYWQQVISEIKSSSDVSEDNSLNYAAVWAAMELTTDTMSTVPLQVFKRTDKGRELHRDYQLYKVLHDQANNIESAQQFRETFWWNMEMKGIGIAEIVRNGKGVAALWNISPSDVSQIEQVGSKLNFIINGKSYEQNRIFFCYGPGRNGLTPRGRITVAREAIGLGLSMQKYGGKYFKNGTNVGTILSHPAKLGDTAYKRLKDSLASQYTGADNAHKNMILEEGMTLTRANMSNEDSQFLESRKFQISDIARFFSVKPHMIGDLEKATFSNIEQQGIEAVTYCWRPRAVRFEQAINMQLINDNSVYAEHNLDGLMQGDLKSQMDSWHIGVQDGIFNANEVREKLNMNKQPDDQGDIYFFPMNMINKKDVGKEPTEPTAETDDERTKLEIADNAAKIYGLKFNRSNYLSKANKLLKHNIEPIRLRNALKLTAMQSAGVKKVKWVSRDNCEICQHLNGKVVNIGEAFEGKAKHPPLSEGCKCTIVDAELNL